MSASGERGSGDFEPISWDEALTTVGSRVSRLKIENQADSVRLLSGRVRGHLDELFSQFMELLGSSHYQQYDFTYPHALKAANKISFGTDELPYYDIKNADYLISFGADYLGTWISPVHHSLVYGHLRQGRDGRRGKTVQVEPRMSISGANADEWIAAAPDADIGARMRSGLYSAFSPAWPRAQVRPWLTGCTGLPSIFLARPSRIRTEIPQPAEH